MQIDTINSLQEIFGGNSSVDTKMNEEFELKPEGHLHNLSSIEVID